MSKVELFVGLKIPDTTAITTFHTLEKLGYKIENVKREMYYKFDIDGDIDKFSKKIGKVDILVNANKNKFSTKLEKEEGAIYVLVKDRGDKCKGLLSTLRDRLGLKEIKSMEKGTLWMIYVDSVDTAKEIAKKLLYNENYQEMVLF
jgi:phosphoribosylformylglycinamidine (FGAM) synthase PurS component